MNYPREFYATTFDVLRNYREYKSYQGKIASAVKVIAKKHPDIPISEINALFNKSLIIYNEALELIKQYPDFNSNSPLHLSPSMQMEFMMKYNEFPEEYLNWIMGWIYHWYFER